MLTSRGRALTVLLLVLAPVVVAQDAGWFPFQPKPDPFTPNSAIDLRTLNEPQAGDGGFIAVKDGQFVHSKTGEPVRFWAVNGCPGDNPEQLRHSARVLAKYGVNLARLHGGMFDEKGDLDPKKVQHTIDEVAALKQQGVYSHLSTYFPLWLEPKPNMPGLAGYDGHHHPFAALYFNPAFQERYRGWWKALLTTPDHNGKKLIDDPAVFGCEIINEDSYFFWTFDAKNIPDPELKIIETQFGSWLKQKYGSLAAASARWNKEANGREDFNAGRVGFQPLWNIANQRTPRDVDTATFLAESQRAFYKQTYDYLRGLGFKGVICASNWATADPRVLGPLEKWTYTACDFIDGHGYFGSAMKGENAAWSIRDGYTYADEDALKFEAPEPGKPRAFVNTIMDPHYDGKPSMASEISFTRPNRYRSEAPLYYACYAALQDGNAIVQFAYDGSSFSTKPGYWIQPWTLMTPGQMGQFPAAALVYRKGLVAVGQNVASINLKVSDLLALKGTPMPQDAAFDELRLKDVPTGTTIPPGKVIDPLCHYVGRTSVQFTKEGGPAKLADLAPFVDQARQMVTSSTRELTLDYGRGIMTIDAPAAQGLNGNLRSAGEAKLKDLVIRSDLALGQIIAVALDGKPLAQSDRILLQVMSEEKPTGWEEQDEGNGIHRIVHVGKDPWQVKAFNGTVKFTRADAASLKVTPLDFLGYPEEKNAAGSAAEIALQPNTVYYLIHR
jgi:hypothetical protein